MLNQLHTAWRARRVLIISPVFRLASFLETLLEELGAKPARIAPSADIPTLFNAMNTGRISAIIVPELRMISPQSSLFAQLSALHALLSEAREAGVPLVLFLSDAGVSRAPQQPWLIRESDPIGGETEDGLHQSILQLYADGVSRGLSGDAVHSIIVRHLPLLGCGHPAVQHALDWCAALDHGELVPVAHPGAAGVFIHPLDALGGALALGARFFLQDPSCTGIFNLSADPQNLIANRTAALRLIRENGGRRPIRESEPPCTPSLPLLDGSRAQRLCGLRCLIPGQEALHMLLSLERAQRRSEKAYADEVLTQTQIYLRRIP